MVEAENPEKPTFKLKLLVDKKKNKVVLAESGKEFVDVLFSFLTLPMGTIVRLLEKYQQDQKSQATTTIGCFNNLYKTVFDLGIDNFLSEACKDMLLYPRSVNEKQRRKLRLNIDETVLKYYRCPNVGGGLCMSSCSGVYSNFCSTRCSCGTLLGKEIEVGHTVGCDEIFVSDKTLFTITDNMEVGFTSMGLTLKTLKILGYTDATQLHEMLVDVDHDKILDLLQCLFSSDTPLTDVLLMKRRSCVITKPILPLQEGYTGTIGSNEVMSVTVFTSKLDKKILYVESGKDFVDLLFTFLALPLKDVWKMSGSNVVLGCIDNLCESFQSLNSSNGRSALSGKCRVPWYYSCQQPLLDVCYVDLGSDLLVLIYSNYITLKPMDPRRNKPYEYSECSGFVKKGKTFMVSDDLIITPTNLSLSICSLKKWNIHLDDIEDQVIDITKTEAIRLLRASFMTSTALNTVFGSLLPKKPKEEKL